jgi:peptidoglycan/LPS O-acetylase OafA/YrhL
MTVSSPNAPHDNRVHGLDIFRSLAILCVLVGHTFEHSKLPTEIQVFGKLGILGVELFFALSGFLIGGIIMRLIDQGKFHTFADVRVFWKRRWLRTLPLYFIALLAFLRFDYHGRHGLLDYPTYFLFMQSFAGRIPEFFELSWSLAIEEHFYLWFPLALLLWYRVVRKMGLAIVLSALSFVCIAYVFRLSQPVFSDWKDYLFLIRMTVLSRMDAIMFGVLIAAIKHHKPIVFAFIRSVTPLTAAVLLLLETWWFVNSPHMMDSRFIQTNLFTFQSVLCALLLPWFDGLTGRHSEQSLFTVTSKLSYSLYLVHILVIIGVNTQLIHFGIYDVAYNNPFILYPLYFGLFYMVAWVTYHRIEKPFLSLRDVPFSLRSFLQASWFSLLVCAFLIFLA